MIENPWHALPSEPPFVLPEDLAVVREFNRRASKDHKLRINRLLPEPYVGDPNAPVVFLGNNPGFGNAARYRMEPYFRERMRNNLLHKKVDCPFVYFDPDLNEILRYWWESKLRGLLRHGFKHDVLARSILAVEHFPYPSRNYRGWRDPLPSKAQDYSFSLVRKAMQRKATIVLMRGRKRWLRALPELERYKRFYRLNNPMAGTISERNCENFKKIVRAIGAGTV